MAFADRNVPLCGVYSGSAVCFIRPYNGRSYWTSDRAGFGSGRAVFPHVGGETAPTAR